MERLKQAIIFTAKLHEESWYVHEEHGEYSISIKDAADQAAEEVGFDLQGTQLIYLLLTHAWNEILEWANEKEN